MAPVVVADIFDLEPDEIDDSEEVLADYKVKLSVTGIVGTSGVKGQVVLLAGERDDVRQYLLKRVYGDGSSQTADYVDRLIDAGVQL